MASELALEAVFRMTLMPGAATDGGAGGLGLRCPDGGLDG
jgi:hypothetical protein